MIGRSLAAALRERGDDVRILTRSPGDGAGLIQWDPARGIPDPGLVAGTDAVVNLTGAPIADRPWTRQRRKVLWESRVDATNNLIGSLGLLAEPPRVFVGTSGLGLFGDRGDAIVDDDDPPGTGFLADLAGAWEGAHLKAGNALGARAAVLRMELVLSPTGGAFPLLVRPFRYVGGWLGNGRQYTSWISIRDCVGALLWLVDHPDCHGGFNGTVPEAIPNKEWCKALGRVLHRPVITHAPKWALRGALGELADELFLASIRAIPRKLQESGYEFLDTEAEATFAWLVEALDGA
jgi:uncharacterized protein (TIGR01777 family)